MSGDHDIVWAAAIAAVPATVAAVAGLAAARSGKANRKSIDTGNGRDIGTTVHDMAQTVEVIAAQTHTNTTELLGIGRKLDDHLERADPLVAQYEIDLKERGKG